MPEMKMVPAEKPLTQIDATALLFSLVGTAIAAKILTVRPRPRLAGTFLQWSTFAVVARDRLEAAGVGWGDLETLIQAGSIIYATLTGKDPAAEGEAP